MRNRSFFILLCLFLQLLLHAQKTDTALLLKPERVFDGEQMHAHWGVLVKNNIIVAAGDMSELVPDGIYKIIELKGTTLLPGFIEGHSHLFLHPYNETKWDEQVMNESIAERTAR